MFSLRDLRSVLCSRDLDVLRAQRIMGFSSLNYPQINEVGKYDHVVKIHLMNVMKKKSMSNVHRRIPTCTTLSFSLRRLLNQLMLTAHLHINSPCPRTFFGVF